MIQLTEEEAQIVLSMIDLINALPTCADELVDCDMDEFNALEEKLRLT